MGPVRSGRAARAARGFAIGLLVVVLLAEVGARVVLAAADRPVLRWHDWSAQLKVEQMEAADGADVVIAGTSMAQQDLVPSVLSAELGEEVYNAGLNGGVPTVMEPWLLDEVEPRLDPDLVVWGLSTLDLSVSYGDAIEDAYATAPATRSGVMGRIERSAARVSRLVESRVVLRDPSALAGTRRDEAIESVAEAWEELGPGGERLAFERNTSTDRRREILSRITPFDLDRDDLAAIARTVEELRDRGVGVVLVVLPVPERLRALYPGGPDQHEIVVRALELLGRELDVPVERLGDDATDADYVDFTHLDADAAARVSAELAGRLDR